MTRRTAQLGQTMVLLPWSKERRDREGVLIYTLGFRGEDILEFSTANFLK